MCAKRSDHAGTQRAPNQQAALGSPSANPITAGISRQTAGDRELGPASDGRSPVADLGGTSFAYFQAPSAEYPLVLMKTGLWSLCSSLVL